MDGGALKADTGINRAFPGLKDTKTSLRKCTLDINAVFFDSIEAKLQIDFANINEVKDEWFRFTNNPVLQRFKFGNMKEPFSLENSSSDMNLNFMERALPAMVFSPGRNIGIRYDDLESAGNLTWAVGAFLNTDSFNSAGSAADQIGKSNGWDLTGRITYFLNRNKKKRDFLHLGLSYTHQFRGKVGEENDIKFSALPESYLTGTRLVDTGKFAVDSVDILDTEVAYASGPFSAQGEWFNAFADKSEGGTSCFWGFYASGSYFLTGESRLYDKSRGVFQEISPIHPFRPLRGQWGALELALRWSYVDLKSAGIRGGRERNLSAGLNWYLWPKTRLMFNYIRATLLESETPHVRNSCANIYMLRLQFGF